MMTTASPEDAFDVVTESSNVLNEGQLVGTSGDEFVVVNTATDVVGKKLPASSLLL